MLDPPVSDRFENRALNAVIEFVVSVSFRLGHES